MARQYRALGKAWIDPANAVPEGRYEPGASESKDRGLSEDNPRDDNNAHRRKNQLILPE